MGVVKDVVTSDGKKLFKALEELAKLEVRVGFQKGEATADNGTDIADIAMWNEVGTVHIPPRPFMRNSVDSNEGVIKGNCLKVAEAVVNGMSAEQALDILGNMQKGLIQDSIESGGYTPNAPSTIRKKGSSTPLIDTGLMRQSVNYVVQPKGQGD